MSAKVHLHMHVSDLDKSHEFYRAFFGSAPVKEKPGYVKFLPEWAPVNLALSEGGGPGAGRSTTSASRSTRRPRSRRSSRASRPPGCRCARRWA